LDWYDRAISLNPEWSSIYVAKALFHLLRTGDAVASESIVREAPDPVDPQWNSYLSYHRLHAGRYEEALELVAADTIRAYDSPSYVYPKPLWMALVSSCTDNNERTQELAEASLAYLQGRIRNESQDPRLRLALGQTYALLGRKAEALREGRMAIDIFPMSRDAIRGHAYQVRQSEIYALAGEKEAALDLLEQLMAIPGGLSPNLIKTNPLYRSLHDNPRYEALIAGAS
jgi:tetratricopeptide (TPR) repeat protein